MTIKDLKLWTYLFTWLFTFPALLYKLTYLRGGSPWSSISQTRHIQGWFPVKLNFTNSPLQGLVPREVLLHKLALSRGGSPRSSTSQTRHFQGWFPVKLYFANSPLSGVVPCDVMHCKLTILKLRGVYPCFLSKQLQRSLLGICI